MVYITQRYLRAVRDCPTDVGTECVEKFSIGRNNKIIGWCGILWSNTADVTQPCLFQILKPTINFLILNLKTTLTQTRFSWYKGSYDERVVLRVRLTGHVAMGGVDKEFVTDMRFVLESPQGRRKRVVVYETGQISVENVEVDTTCSNI